MLHINQSQISPPFPRPSLLSAHLERFSDGVPQLGAVRQGHRLRAALLGPALLLLLLGLGLPPGQLQTVLGRRLEGDDGRLAAHVAETARHRLVLRALRVGAGTGVRRRRLW